MRKSIQVENDYISSFYDIVSIQSPNLLDPSKQNLQYVLLQGKRTLCKSTVLCLSLHRSRESSTYISYIAREGSFFLPTRQKPRCAKVYSLDVLSLSELDHVKRQQEFSILNSFSVIATLIVLHHHNLVLLFFRLSLHVS